MHQVYTYDQEKVAYCVGNHNGRVLFRLMITFEPEFLRSYDEVLQFLCNNGLNLFYDSDIDKLPLDLIEGVLLSSRHTKDKVKISTQ